MDERTSDAERFDLSIGKSERAVLLAACKKYRLAIPAYLKSRQSEIEALDDIIKRLSS